ncbi:MAG: imidazole glycerol phosphate synthase subunit HisH [Erysipelotrichaceae bacterium]
MIVIIDYGMGNLKSVYNALLRIECETKISNKEEDIINADGLILPGVGAFEDCMLNLTNSGLIPVIKSEVAKGKPLLGICLGMQILFEKGYEGNETSGLGLLKGNIKLMHDSEVRIPHIGWNNLIINNEDPIAKNLSNNSYVYYVHSYCATEMNETELVAYSTYGTIKIPGLVRKGNVMGAQFHPEKSGEEGLTILKNFKEIVE